MSVRERSCARSLKCALCTESIIDSFDIYRRRRLMFNDVQELVIAKKAKKKWRSVSDLRVHNLSSPAIAPRRFYANLKEPRGVVGPI